MIYKIYSEKSLARVVLDGYSNGGWSFLLYALMNKEQVLTSQQKRFAIREATNKVGTKKSEKEINDYKKRLKKAGKSDLVLNTEFGQVDAESFNIYMSFYNARTF